jgi:hypothetical protein
MAVYKIFSEKDTFISSYRNTQNFGRDEILEIANLTNATSVNADVTRALIQFQTSQITNVINNIISGSAYSSSLKLFLAEATLPVDYTIYAYPLSQSWDMGLGRSSDFPITTTGVTWGIQPGYYNSPSSSQSFNYIDNKDININVNSIVSSWISSSNNGLILKLSSSIENSDTPLITKFFSMDSHTIYPPQLEFKWDDSSYSSSLTQVTSSNFISVLTNNKSTFEETSVYTFKIKTRDIYPTRTFQTSSVYLNTKALPSSSYWALKDVKTEEMVVDFDTTFTKISCDNTSNYFKIYMDGLEPERYYQIIYKTVLSGGETVIVDNKSNYFKVVR